MKTETKKIRTQIADISVNGRELHEENLRFVAGGFIYRRTTYCPTQLRNGTWVRDVCD